MFLKFSRVIYFYFIINLSLQFDILYKNIWNIFYQVYQFWEISILYFLFIVVKNL